MNLHIEPIARNPIKFIQYMKRLYLLLITLSLFQVTASAQKFQVDHLFRDSVSVRQMTLTETDWVEADGSPKMMLPDGYEFESIDIDPDESRIIFAIDGKYYRIPFGNVRFSKDNPKDVSNPLPPKTVRSHSALAHFFATLTPYIIIVLLIAGGMATGMAGLRIRSLKKPATVILPACLAAASLIEVLAFFMIGDDMVWWCDDDLQGFWGALVGAIPFTAVILMQFYSMKLYSTLIFGDQSGLDEDQRKKISLKPVAWGIGLLLPVTFVLMLIMGLAGIEGTFPDMIALLVAVAISAILIAKGFRENIRTFGAGNGIAASVFSIVYLLGLIISAVLLVIVIFKIILQIIIMAALAVGCLFCISLMSKDSASGSPQMMYHAKDGTRYQYSADAEKHDQDRDSKRG